MLTLAASPLAPILGQRLPVRGLDRLLLSSHARTSYHPHESVTRVTTRDGDVFDVNLSSSLEWQLWAFGGYGRHLAELFRHVVRPGDRCVDVGANVGMHTVRLARLVGGEGEVIAIEPDPDVVRRAQRNIALNSLANIRIVCAAASERPGEMQLYRPGPWDPNRGRASLLRHRYLTGARVTVPVVTVDDVCGDAPVALIKIAAEGHETSVIHGAASAIARNAPAVMFEYAPAAPAAAAQAPFGWLAERGYEFFRVRAARHRVTGRERLALDRLLEWPREGGSFLAVPGARRGRAFAARTDTALTKSDRQSTVCA